MTRLSICSCFFAAGLVMSCAPTKPAETDPKPVAEAPKKVEEPVQPVAPTPIIRESGMREPDDTASLPSEKDMRPTSPTGPPSQNSGATIRVSPPADPKPQ